MSKTDDILRSRANAIILVHKEYKRELSQNLAFAGNYFKNEITSELRKKYRIDELEREYIKIATHFVNKRSSPIFLKKKLKFY